MTLSGEERGGKLPDGNIHMDDTKSAKTGTDRKKKKERHSVHSQGSATLYLSRPNKGRPAERCDYVYFPLRTMHLRGGGKD